MKTTMLIAAGAILVCAVGTAMARSIERPCVVDKAENGTLLVRVQALETEGTITIGENEEIVFAELTFEDPLPAGTEVEIWPALEGETPAWEQGPEFPFKRNLWIVDGRTGSLVRFDITQIARAWQSQELPDLGLVVRVVSTEDDLGNAATAEFSGSKSMSLRYQLVRSERPRTTGEGKETPSVKTSPIEDGKTD